MFIALHAGAGFFADSAEKYCADALKQTIAKNNWKIDGAAKSNKAAEEAIVAKGTACGVCPLVDAIMFLERCAALNCGLGSNLTVAGSVECEAAYMSSRQMAYGAVAVVVQVTNCVHPICAAKALADPYSNYCCSNSPYSSVNASTGLVQPMVLAGPGADKMCESLGIGIVEHNEELRTRCAIKEFRSAKQKVALAADDNKLPTPTTLPLELEKNSVFRLDTVGGVTIDPHGMCEACVSSGGILLKREGRLGHSAQFGAAIWAEQCSAAADSACGGLSVAVSVSGCGEALTRTHFAEALAQQILSMDVDDLAFAQRISHFLQHHYVRSRRLCSFPSDRLLLGGLAVIQLQNRKCQGDEEDAEYDNGTKKFSRILLLAFHNTIHFPFAFAGPDQKIQRFKSKSSKEGQFACNLFSI